MMTKAKIINTSTTHIVVSLLGGEIAYELLSATSKYTPLPLDSYLPQTDSYRNCSMGFLS